MLTALGLNSVGAVMDLRSPFSNFHDEPLTQQKISLNQVIDSSKALYASFQRKRMKKDMNPLSSKISSNKGSAMKNNSTNCKKNVKSGPAFKFKTFCGSSTRGGSATAANFLHFVRCTSSDFESTPTIKEIKKKISVAVRASFKVNSGDFEGTLKPQRKNVEKKKIIIAWDDCTLPPREKVVGVALKEFRSSSSYQVLQESCFDTLTMLHTSQIIPSRERGSATAHSLLHKSLDAGRQCSASVEKRVVLATSPYLCNRGETVAEVLFFEEVVTNGCVDPNENGSTTNIRYHCSTPPHNVVSNSFESVTDCGVKRHPESTKELRSVAEWITFSQHSGSEDEERGDFVSSFAFSQNKRVDEALCVVKKDLKDSMKTKVGHSSPFLSSLRCRSRISNQEASSQSSMFSSISSTFEGRGQANLHSPEKESEPFVNMEKEGKGAERATTLTFYNALKVLVESKVIDILLEEDNLYWDGLVAFILQFLQGKEQHRISCEILNTLNCPITPGVLSERFNVFGQLGLQMCEAASGFQLHQFLVEILHLMESEFCQVSVVEVVRKAECSNPKTVCEQTSPSNFLSTSTKPPNLVRFVSSQQQPPVCDHSFHLLTSESSSKDRLYFVASFALQLLDFLPQCWFSLAEEEVREVLYGALRISLHLSALFSVLDSSAKWLETWITQRSCVAHQLAVWSVTYPEEFLTLCQSSTRHGSAGSLESSSEEGGRSRAGNKEDSYRLAVVSLVLPLVCGMYLSPCCPPHTFSSQCSVSQEHQKWVTECLRTFFCSIFSLSSFSSLLQPDRSSCLTMIVAACFQSRRHFPVPLQSSLRSLVLPFLLSLSPHIGDVGFSKRVNPLALNRIFQLVLLFIPSEKYFQPFIFEEGRESSQTSALHQLKITGSEKGCAEPLCDTSLEDLDRWVATLLGSVLDTLQEIFSAATTISTPFSCTSVEDKFRPKEQETSTPRNLFQPDLWSSCRQYLHVLQSFCIAALPHIADRFSATLSLCFRRISDLSLRNFFAFLELPSTEFQTERSESDIRCTSCAYCPSFCHLLIAASIHPCGWVQIRQLYGHSSLSVKRNETTFLMGTPLSSTSVPLACISTCQLLFSILTCNVPLMNEKKMCDELPCYSPPNCYTSTKSRSAFRLRNYCNAKFWLTLLAVLTPFSSIAASASPSFPVCLSCTAMYRSSIHDRSTSLFLLQRWSTVSASFFKLSFSEVPEKVCNRITKYLESSLPLGATSEARRCLCPISPASQEDALWSETYESSVNDGGPSGIRRDRLFSSFSYASLLLWQSFFHSCLVLEAPFPPRAFFSDFRKSRRNDGTAKACCTDSLSVGISPKSEGSQSSFLPSSLLSRATEQLKAWRFVRHGGSRDAKANDGDKEGSHVKHLHTSHFTVPGDRSALFAVLTLIAWGLWLSPVAEEALVTSSVTTADSTEDSQARSAPAAVVLFGSKCCGRSSSFDFKSLLECTDELLCEGSEENKHEENFIDPCTILFATIVCSFFEKVGNSPFHFSEEVRRDAEYSKNGLQYGLTVEDEEKESHPSLSSDHLTALMLLMRDGAEVSWSSDTLYSSTWLSLLEKSHKWKFYYRHHHQNSAPPANMEFGHAFYSFNSYQANSLSDVAVPASAFSFLLTENSSISSSLRAVELHLSCNSHWKRWTKSFFSLASYTTITAAHIQRFAALMTLYEMHCHGSVDGPHAVRKSSSSEGPMRKKGLEKDLAEKWESTMALVLERVVRQCTLRNTWEWELFLGVEREAIFPSITTPSQIHSEVSKTVDTASVNCFVSSSSIKMAFFDKWKLVREIVTAIYEKQLVDSKVFSALSFHGIDLFWLIHVGITTWIAPPSLLFNSSSAITSQKKFFEQNAAYFVSCYTFLYYGAQRWKNWLASKFGAFISRSVSCASEESSLEEGTKTSTPKKNTDEKGGVIASDNSDELQCISRASGSYFSTAKQQCFFPHASTLDTQHLSGVPAISSVCSTMLLHGFYHSSSIFVEDVDLK